jgi:hypothetical protein
MIINEEQIGTNICGGGRRLMWGTIPDFPEGPEDNKDKRQLGQPVSVTCRLQSRSAIHSVATLRLNRKKPNDLTG